MNYRGFQINTIDFKNKAFSFSVLPTIIFSKDKLELQILIIVFFWAIKFMFSKD